MPSAPSQNIVFLFIGGPHQVFHLAPVAAELCRIRPEARVECLYPDEATGAVLRAVRERLDCPGLVLTRVEVPGWAARLARTTHRQAVTKLPLLLRLAWRIRGADAVVTPERTSAFLRWFGVRRPLFIHFRHGAGDRAPKSEKRLKAFDLVVAPGDKDVRRAVEARKLSEARLRVSGYVKLDYLANLSAAPPRLFDDDRPVVVYNPHFDCALSSWPQARAIVAAFAAQGEYHLVIAPHIRLSRDMAAAEAAEWHSLAVPGHILVDLDSPRLLDMTYMRAADVYLGDVSSQLYEFLSEPRPAVFVNSRGARWQDDPRYAGWHLGEVANGPGDVIAAIDRAITGQAALIERQRSAVAEAFGPYVGASQRGAAIVAEAVERRTGLAPAGSPMLT